MDLKYLISASEAMIDFIFTDNVMIKTTKYRVTMVSNASSLQVPSKP